MSNDVKKLLIISESGYISEILPLKKEKERERSYTYPGVPLRDEFMFKKTVLSK